MPSRSDEAAIERIWREFHERLRTFLLARVRDAATADDLLQEVFLKVHRSIDSLRDEQRLAAWLFQITRNALADHHRARHEVSAPENDSALEALAAEENPAAAEQSLAASLLAMMRDLPAPYREALELTELEGLTQGELAELLGLSLSGAKSRVQRGREKLKALLLDCCHVELDRRGGVAHYETRRSCCQGRRPARSSGNP